VNEGFRPEMKNLNLSKIYFSQLQAQHRASTSDGLGELQELSFASYIDSILNHLTQTVYQVVSWALFAEHQLIFSFSVCLNILKHPASGSEQKITHKENNFFLVSTLLADMQQNALTEKIKLLGDFKVYASLSLDEKMLRQILLLEETIPQKFTGLCVNMKVNNEKLWSEFIACNDPYKYMASNGKFNLFLLIL